MTERDEFTVGFEKGFNAFLAGHARGTSADPFDESDEFTSGFLFGWDEAEMHVLEHHAYNAGWNAAWDESTHPCPYPTSEYRLVEEWAKGWIESAVWTAYHCPEVH